jgi:DNA-binding NtrC family response regulator/tetratricopeptide (TPR) repeat protein
MRCIVADRFLALRDVWIDLATGALVKLRITPAGTSRSQFEWSARCEVLANLRHPLINPLVDFGAVDRAHVFEAYAASGPLAVRGSAAESLALHAVRFLERYGVDLPRPIADFALRPIARGTVRSVRPIGVFLQRRNVFDAIADTLDAASPGGTCAVLVEGSQGSGLRTLLLASARAARLRGYVPLSAGAIRRFPWLLDRVLDRHVCVLGGAGTDVATPAVVRDATLLMTRLAAVSARRHLVLSFARPGVARGHIVHVDSMGVTAMTGMVFADPELGPSAEEILEAVRNSEGRPGLCLARLGTREYGPNPARWMTVHESPQPYEVGQHATSAGLRLPPRQHSSPGVVQRSVERAEALARRGRHAAADRILSRAVRVLSARGEQDRAARASLLLGWLARDRARAASAAAHFQRARDIGSDPSTALLATIGLGVTLTDDGRLLEAEAVLRTVMTAAEELPDVAGAAAAALARAYLWRDQPLDALTVLSGVGDTASIGTRARVCAVLARAHLAEGTIPAAVRAARAAVEAGETAADPRSIAAAYRSLGAAVAAAGDRESAERHFTDGLRIATAAHLSLTAIRLRLAAADARVSSTDLRHLDRIVAHAHEWPRLLQFTARAVQARLAGRDLDPPTRSFIASSHARALDRPLASPPINAVADLEALLDLAHAAPDDRGAVERIAAEIHSRLKTTTVMVVSGLPERRVVAVAGRAWHGDPHIAWRALAGGLSVPVDATFEPAQGAEPLRYGGEIIGALAARWTAGASVDAARVTGLLRVAAVAMAASVRAVLDRGAPAAPHGVWPDLVGESGAAQSLRDSIARAARAPFPVLIQGESGSGKELVARAIHRLGPRRDRRFSALNCAALSDELIEAELFGHARGAFTGAIGERAGLFEEADGGTLFLDEIGELSGRAQAKLLRVLQDGEVRRVGENVARRVDVRIVAATNRRLADEVAAGRFRADLRFRLDVVRIEVPALRDRAGDVPILATRFWSDAAAKVGSRATLAPDAVAALARYDWPGNVRELQNVIAWMAVHSPTRGRIGLSGLPEHVAHGDVIPAGSLEAAKEEFERRFVKAALASAGGQRARAARALGVTRQGLAKMMRRLGIG